MAQRTTIKLVIESLGANYGPVKGVPPNIQPWIDMANSTVDFLQGVAVGRGRGLLPVQQELVERTLACHYYTKMDPLYASNSQGGGSGSFVSDPKEPERYRCLACNLDTSGFLTAVLNRQFAEGVYLGKDHGHRDDYSRLGRH